MTHERVVIWDCEFTYVALCIESCKTIVIKIISMACAELL